MLFAAVVNDLHRAAGRSGVGAVMGSKNLKAIAVRGTLGVGNLPDPKGFMQVTNEKKKVLADHAVTEAELAEGATLAQEITSKAKSALVSISYSL